MILAKDNGYLGHVKQLCIGSNVRVTCNYTLTLTTYRSNNYFSYLFSYVPI